MTLRRLGTNLVLAAIFVSGTVFAQQTKKDEQTVAKLIDLKGTVLVNGAGPMATGANNQRLAVNTRIVTGPGSKATINYDKGCEVRLNENQRFTVREEGECCARIDSVESTNGGSQNGAARAAFEQLLIKNEGTVAKLTNLEGTILISEGDAMAAGATDQRLKIDTRVVTTAASQVTINYDRGCDVRLYENQRFTVRDRGGCCALIAAVEHIAAPVAAVSTGGISGLGIIGATAVAGGVIFGVGRTDTNVSPN